MKQAIGDEHSGSDDAGALGAAAGAGGDTRDAAGTGGGAREAAG